MTIEEFMLRLLRKVVHLPRHIAPKKDDKGQGSQFYGYVELFDQDANDYVRDLLHKGYPCMISKFGTVELNALVNYMLSAKAHHSLKEYLDFIIGRIPNVGWLDRNSINILCSNAGFSPMTYLCYQNFSIFIIKP